MNIKRHFPNWIKNYGKSIISWKNPGEFPKSISRFIDRRGLQIKRYIFIPIFTILNPIHYFQEFRLYKKIQSDFCPVPKFEIDRKIGFGLVNLNRDDVNTCVEFALSALSATQKGPKQEYDKDYLQAITNLAKVDASSEILKIFTSKEILSAVTNYLGAAPILADLSVLYSPEPKIGNNHDVYTGSQLFHRDGDGTRCLKIWILCNPVMKENGPTVLLPSHLSDKIGIRHMYHPGDKIPTDKWFEKEDSKLFYATGDTGTSFATDTISCFHMGSRTKNQSSRLVLMAHFVTPYSTYFRPRSALSMRTKYSFRGKHSSLSTEAKILLRPYLN